MINQLSNSQHQPRVQSVDVLRGAVMVLMAIDHVRVYSGIPSASIDPGIFFTRWVTHFCVPAFVFFAGSSAFIYKKKVNSLPALSKFLLGRGFLLILLELTLIRFFWTFNLDFGIFTLAGVIWMLGWCMVLLSILVRMPMRVIWTAGLAIILFQQVFSLVPRLLPHEWRIPFSWFWEFIYSSGYPGPRGVAILYVIFPWIGVMMAGYGFGLILTSQPEMRKKLCLWIGLSAIALFLIGASLNIYFGSFQVKIPFIFRLLAQQKYPPSQLYLLMTLGPVIALVPYSEKAHGWFANILMTFGRVPFFYYLVHILLIHLSSLVVNLIRTGNAHQDWYSTAPYTELPASVRWGLPTLYLVYFIVLIILYMACRIYSKYKFYHPEMKWLKYI